MQLAIVQNPHTEDPKSLWNELDRMDGLQGIRDETMDKEGLLRLKEQLQGSRFIKAK